MYNSFNMGCARSCNNMCGFNNGCGCSYRQFTQGCAQIKHGIENFYRDARIIEHGLRNVERGYYGNHCGNSCCGCCNSCDCFGGFNGWL